MTVNNRTASSIGLFLLISGLALGACDETAEADPASFRALDLPWQIIPGWPPPGGTLNTASLGTTPLMRLLLPGYPGANGNNVRTSDAVIHSVELMRSRSFEEVTSISAISGELSITTDDGDFRGADLIDSRWWLDEQKTRYITITDYGEAAGFKGYQFEHHWTVSGPANPMICTPDVDGNHWAYVVGDVLVQPTGSITNDPGALLIACSSGALGKAITWGFTPWDETNQTLDLYQTGVRTVMADYCGDGSSYTEDGTLIQVHNDLAGQGFVNPTTENEAVFGPDGALCLSEPRAASHAPDCEIPVCGDEVEIDLLMTESFHTWTKLGSFDSEES